MKILSCHALFFWMALLLVLPACKQGENQARDVAPSQSIASAPAQVDWEAEFRRIHGSKYDPLSRADREKMARLQGQTPIPAPVPTPAPVIDKMALRERILDVSRGLTGQTETHGPNRSPIIDQMNRLTGVPLGSPYCASHNAWCYTQAGAPKGSFPVSAWSPDWVKNPSWTRAKGGRTPQAADAGGIYSQSMGRINHTFLIEDWQKSSALTREGNTSPSAEFGSASDRDGDGFWRKRRLISQIYAVRDWIDP